MTTIGVVSCGELGTEFAKLLIARGVEVVTCSEGRSARTQAASRRTGVRELSSLWEVIRDSEILLSVVHPNQAESLALLYLELLGGSTSNRIFVDMNSIAPDTILRVADTFDRLALPFVDAALVGPASLLGTSATLYLSGEGAEQVSRAIGLGVRSKVLGPKPGEASRLKMLLGGMSKGLAALFIELGVAAEAMGTLPSFLREYEANYPAVMCLLERMVPTYALHAERRGQELRELEGMLRSLEIEPSVVAGARRVISRMIDSDLKPGNPLEAFLYQIATRSDDLNTS